MKKMTSYVAGTALCTMLGAGFAMAGGLDRSGQSIGILFQQGSVAELSFGTVDPAVSGTAFGFPTGDMAPAYVVPAVGVKFDLGEKVSVALILDTPFGADALYGAGSPYAGISATVDSSALTAVVGYDVSERFKVFGGASYQTISGSVVLPGAPTYTFDLDPASGVGLVAGAAYQIPAIALRVALTYRSEVTSTHTETETAGATFPGTMDITTPQSLNLEFQTGLNPKTLLFGSVRWVDWSSFAVVAPVGGTLVSYSDDVVTYSLGVGRKITEALSIAVTAGYEQSTGTPSSVLSPTDGNFSLGVGASYDLGSGKISGGVRYVWLGDATDIYGQPFTDNYAVAVGMKYAWEF